MSSSRHPVVRSLLIAATLSLTTGQIAAQSVSIIDLQKNIDIFTGVLAEALDLEQETGLFGISLGNIDSTYLWGQGVVLEVRTPLASRRNNVSLASLSATLQNLQARANPFAALAQSQSAGTTAMRSNSPSAPENDANDFYRTMMERIANVDYSLVVNSAIQQASEYARSLRSLDGVDDQAYESLRDEIAELRDEMRTQFARLREVEETAKRSSAVGIEQENMQALLDNVLASLEALRGRAVAKAEELRERSRVAEQAYAASWQQEVFDFEDKLYGAMCNYGATLRELPVGENVSVILTGLGDDTGDKRRTDKVHVFAKADLVACQNGTIDRLVLQQRAKHYSY